MSSYQPPRFLTGKTPRVLILIELEYVLLRIGLTGREIESIVLILIELEYVLLPRT